MNKRVLVASLLIIVLGLLVTSFITLQRREERREEERFRAYARGEALYREGRYAQALEQLRKVRETYPQSQEAHRARQRIAFALIGLGDYEEAENYFQEYLRDFPESDAAAKIHYQLGALAEKQGHLDRALTLYGKVVTDFPPGPVVDEAILGQGRIRAAQGEWRLAREFFQKVMNDFPESNSFLAARRQLGDLNIGLIFSPILTEDSFLYEVQFGDSLYAIARRFNTTVPLLKRSNELKTDRIRPGQTLKVTPGNYRLVADKSEFTLSLYLNERLVKVYLVAVGREGRCTPTGEFEITDKLIDPVWYSPDGFRRPFGHPKNILGTRWIGICLPGYGIHGTTQPETIGKRATQGCVRMLNEDVEELFDLVTPGTPVIIVE